MRWLIRRARLLDPARGVDRVGDLLVEEGKIARVGGEIRVDGEAETVDGEGLVLTPSFIDLPVHLREPGREYAETIESGTVLIREGDVVAEDLYVAANRVQIDGLVEGDLTVAAFGAVVIGGEVEGSVTVLASRVEVTGTVGGSVTPLPMIMAPLDSIQFQTPGGPCPAEHA